MKLIRYKINTGSDNMQIDSDLLNTAVRTKETEPIFRLYGWSPKCISVGRNQNSDFIANIYPHIDCVKRLTGGRALLHDDEVTYSYITPISIIPGGNDIRESYKYISSILVKFFNTLGVNLEIGSNKKISMKRQYCMLLSTGADVCYNGNKIIGSAQYRKEGYILQHGSILFSYDKPLLEQIFGETITGITAVNEILPNLTKDEFVIKFETYLEKFK